MITASIPKKHIDLNRPSDRGVCRRVRIDPSEEYHLVISRSFTPHRSNGFAKRHLLKPGMAAAFLKVIPSRLFKKAVDAKQGDVLCKITFDVDGNPSLEEV